MYVYLHICRCKSIAYLYNKKKGAIAKKFIKLSENYLLMCLAFILDRQDMIVFDDLKD